MRTPNKEHNHTEVTVVTRFAAPVRLNGFLDQRCPGCAWKKFKRIEQLEKGRILFRQLLKRFWRLNDRADATDVSR
jgi:hypothetical protein